ncbi:PREDICTED: uncharacterized protein LOC108774893 [Cyphomyrmex costatus]|uniref:uncharacterized protein LOC108774893 n=1 Tax=Cyphomyrmex costatus TaxID=456900 RepID=UPI00085230FD|nr:PREDICTED: uncharacterized protein LOC108774893 [Cyphomyrmex costatus]
MLQSTKLGWLLCGQIRPPINASSHNNVSICGFVQSEELQAQIERFWRIEDMSNTRLLSKEESMCEDIFQKEYRRTQDGRFEVPLLFREDPISTLGDSRANALRRLRSMEHKFLRDHQLQTRYGKFMDDYIDLGHMSALSVTDTHNQKINYLPHHAVTKEFSISTKLRVVFDASNPTTSGKSLNDCLLVGPTIQSELFEIIIRFREHPYVLVGDIVKMYRQINIKPEHRVHQCILWRSNPEDPPTTYSLNTVTYRVASSPFLAIRSLQQLSVDHEKTHPRAAAVIARDFYVDDMITGAASVQLHELKTQVTDILKTAGFELSKFRSNVSLDQDECLDHYEITDAKVLGLLWQSTTDLLRYEVTCIAMPETITKRITLSLITQIFDPLGLIGPTTIKAKILMQSLWQLKIDWDTPIPETLRIVWLSYFQQLPIINQIAIPRHAILHSPKDIQLHGFCDASQSAYGACVYLRSIDNMGTIYIQLLAAKSRVAPLKTITLPRLELCGAVLLSNLVHRISQALTCTVSKHYLWTDSEIVLAWIQGQPSQWQIFVGNRIAEIQRLTNQSDWAHVRSEHNPADLISRGLMPEQLPDATMWWVGPPWLKTDPPLWPTSSTQFLTDIPEARTQSFTALHKEDSFDIMHRYSSLTKLKRVIATCIRFKTNCMLSKSASQRFSGPLTADELQKTMTILIKRYQQEVFACELHHLRKNNTVDLHSPILSLNPILDQEGVLRVGGRFRNAPCSYTQKHPIFLPSKGVLTDLIIRDLHLKHFHMGPQLLSTAIRETYWIVHAKNAIKRILKTCVLCFRSRPRSSI